MIVVPETSDTVAREEKLRPPTKKELQCLAARTIGRYRGASFYWRCPDHDADIVPCLRNSASLHARGDRARHLDLHHVGAAGHAVDPERKSLMVCRNGDCVALMRFAAEAGDDGAAEGGPRAIFLFVLPR